MAMRPGSSGGSRSGPYGRAESLQEEVASFRRILLSTYTALGRAERQLEVSEGRGGEAAAEASRAIRRAAGLIVLAEGLALAASAPARSDADDKGAQ